LLPGWCTWRWRDGLRAFEHEEVHIATSVAIKRSGIDLRAKAAGFQRLLTARARVQETRRGNEPQAATPAPPPPLRRRKRKDAPVQHPKPAPSPKARGAASRGFRSLTGAVLARACPAP
jgi:hypothetical protein